MKPEIDHHAAKVLVGVIAITLANATAFFSPAVITSISASYYEGGWARDIFVGSLLAIAAFLFAYNGHDLREMVLSKVAAIASIGVAMFPCACEKYPEIIPGVHGTSAAVMFSVLALMCFGFARRARAKAQRAMEWNGHATRRVWLYYASAGAIIASLLAVVLDNVLGGTISAQVPRLTFYAERTGLIAFGVAWLTASRTVPGLVREDERVRLM